ncbi:hypothetical protein DIPPA_35800 [Diplonema papillatum]|nr:hypothetical protein DIPPA_35800 [Diplonema papillatum]
MLFGFGCDEARLRAENEDLKRQLAAERHEKWKCKLQQVFGASLRKPDDATQKKTPEERWTHWRGKQLREAGESNPQPRCACGEPLREAPSVLPPTFQAVPEARRKANPWKTWALGGAAPKYERSPQQAARGGACKACGETASGARYLCVACSKANGASRLLCGKCVHTPRAASPSKGPLLADSEKRRLYFVVDSTARYYETQAMHEFARAFNAHPWTNSPLESDGGNTAERPAAMEDSVRWTVVAGVIDTASLKKRAKRGPPFDGFSAPDLTACRVYDGGGRCLTDDGMAAINEGVAYVVRHGWRAPATPQIRTVKGNAVVLLLDGMQDEIDRIDAANPCSDRGRWLSHLLPVSWLSHLSHLLPVGWVSQLLPVSWHGSDRERPDEEAKLRAAAAAFGAVARAFSDARAAAAAAAGPPPPFFSLATKRTAATASLRSRLGASGGRRCGLPEPAPLLLFVSDLTAPRGGPPWFVRCDDKPLDAERIFQFVVDCHAADPPMRRRLLGPPYFFHDLGLVPEKPDPPPQGSPPVLPQECPGRVALECPVCCVPFESEAAMRHHELTPEHLAVSRQRRAAKKSHRLPMPRRRQLWAAAIVLAAVLWRRQCWALVARVAGPVLRAIAPP